MGIPPPGIFSLFLKRNASAAEIQVQRRMAPDNLRIQYAPHGCRATDSSWIRIERNFSKENVLPRRPARFCTKNTGRPSSAAIASAVVAMSGPNKSNNEPEPSTSKNTFGCSSDTRDALVRVFKPGVAQSC